LFAFLFSIFAIVVVLLLLLPLSFQAYSLIMSLLEPPEHLLKLLHQSLPENAVTKSTADDGQEEILAYVAFLASGLAATKEFDAKVWSDVLEPYLEQMEDAGLDVGVVVEAFWASAVRELTDQDDADSYGDDGEDVEEICNLRFNLAVSMVILSDCSGWSYTNSVQQTHTRLSNF
jgi:hypothetical protein